MNLTPREYEVARLFALGWTWDEVMAETGIRRATIAKHRGEAVRKVGGRLLVDVWRAIGWLRVPNQTRTSDSIPGDESPVAAVTRRPHFRRVG